jgi:hypothetical protein
MVLSGLPALILAATAVLIANGYYQDCRVCHGANNGGHEDPPQDCDRAQGQGLCLPPQAQVSV